MSKSGVNHRFVANTSLMLIYVPFNGSHQVEILRTYICHVNRTSLVYLVYELYIPKLDSFVIIIRFSMFYNIFLIRYFLFICNLFAHRFILSIPI